VNLHSQSDESKRLQELTSAVIDGTADESQLAELTERLRCSEKARDEYLALVDAHAILATDLSIRQLDKQESTHVSSADVDRVVDVAPAVDLEQAANRSNPRWVKAAGLIAVAASVLIALAIVKTNEPSVEPESLGQVAQVTNAVWKSTPVGVGDRFGNSEIQLESGLVRLTIDSGVEVTLEGPAEFKMVDLSHAELNRGILTATVPTGAEGFTVNTPTAEVVDLGTSFGIDLREDGSSNVSVFDGEVEIGARDSDERRLLVEGESVHIGANYAMEDVQFDPKPFEKLWPTASGIVRSTDAFRFLPPWPRPMRFVTSDTDIFVASEGHSAPLRQDVLVNISEPGQYTTPEDLTPTTIPRGQRVRSYLIHYAPATPLGPRRAERIDGTITFNQPVIGIMVDNEELQESGRWLARRNAREGNQRRELNLTGDALGDRVTLSEDRRTVTLDLISPGRTSDLLRVLVERSPGFHRRNHPRPRNFMPPNRRNRN